MMKQDVEFLYSEPLISQTRALLIIVMWLREPLQRRKLQKNIYVKEILSLKSQVVAISNL